MILQILGWLGLSLSTLIVLGVLIHSATTIRRNRK